jgi:4-hydroxybutyrate CoA-transferase
MSVTSDQIANLRRSPTISTADDAASLVRNHDHVVISGCGASPLEFLAALAQRSDLTRVVISHATAWGQLPHLLPTDRPSHLNFAAYFLPALARDLLKQRKVDYVPLTFSLMSNMYADGDLLADVVAVTCSTPDEDGFCSLGPFVNYLPKAIERARVLIGECSPRWPRTGGAARVHVSKFDCLIEVDREPIESSGSDTDFASERIGEEVARLVPNSATIQIGRGAIPNAVAARLVNHRDLGIHSEMLSDWIIELVNSGAVTGKSKKIYPGEIVTSFMDGSARLHAFAAECASLRLEAIYDVNDPDVVGREPNFMAINSAIEVDLSGQINAESLDGELISGSGGLLDFAIGAGRSRGGKFIVALPSTAKKGTFSRIVAKFGAGTAVTVPRSLTQYVVTEYGAADLRGCTLEERAKRLIAIAHPSFRTKLQDESGFDLF